MWFFFVLGALFAVRAQGVDILVVSNTGVSLCNTTLQTSTQLLLDNEMMTKEVDYHHARGEVYTLTKRQILRSSLTPRPGGMDYRPVVYSEDEYNFMSLAVDWVHDAVYWTGGPVFMIHRADLDGKEHRVVYRGYYIENFHKKLLIDPNAGLLIWATTSQLFSATLDGQNIQEIRFPEIVGNVGSRVRNLALDVTRRRVYFMAGFEDDDVWMVMSGNYDGSGFRRHDSVPRYTYTLAAMGDDLYWIAKELQSDSDGHKRTPHSLVLYKGSTQAPSTAERIMDLNTGAIWNMKICDPEFQR